MGHVHLSWWDPAPVLTLCSTHTRCEGHTTMLAAGRKQHHLCTCGCVQQQHSGASPNPLINAAAGEAASGSVKKWRTLWALLAKHSRQSCIGECRQQVGGKPELTAADATHASVGTLLKPMTTPRLEQHLLPTTAAPAPALPATHHSTCTTGWTVHAAANTGMVGALLPLPDWLSRLGRQQLRAHHTQGCLQVQASPRTTPTAERAKPPPCPLP